jgi:hypothetical protein
MESNETRWKVFIEEICRTKIIWTIEKDEQFWTSINRYGTKCFPWWSSRKRTINQIAKVPAYKGYIQSGFTLDQFINEWSPLLKIEKFNIGINYIGIHNIEFDLPLDEVLAAIHSNLKIAQQGDRPEPVSGHNQ